MEEPRKFPPVWESHQLMVPTLVVATKAELPPAQILFGLAVTTGLAGGVNETLTLVLAELVHEAADHEITT